MQLLQEQNKREEEYNTKDMTDEDRKLMVQALTTLTKGVTHYLGDQSDNQA